MGLQQFIIAGVFYDYASDQGVVFMSEKNFIRHWKDDRINSLAVYLGKNGNAAAVSEAFRAKFGSTGEFAFYANRELRSRVFEIFDQTFAVTYVLRSIAIIVAVVGIFFTLTTLVTERTRELAILRAIGASAAQIRRSASLGIRNDRSDFLSAGPGCRNLSFLCAHGRNQSRIFWMDDSHGVSVARPGAYSGLDRGRVRSRRVGCRLCVRPSSR